MRFFITGTDTGIGKTWVSAALAQEFISSGKSVAYYKPVQTGSPLNHPEDPDFIRSVFGDIVPVFNRYCFEPPVTPSVADTQGNIRLETIQADALTLAQQYDVLLIEGAGGLAVPVTPDHLMVDIISALDSPVILVAHSRLGTINHTLLSFNLLQQYRIPVAGLVINFYPPEDEITQAELAVQTLIPTLRPYLPIQLPIWTCQHNKDGHLRREALQLMGPPLSSLAECNKL